MADSTTLGERAKRNGGSHAAEADGDGRGLTERTGPLGAVAAAGTSGLARAGGGVLAAGTGLAGAVLGRLARRAQRALSADLDDRDPDYIRDNLPLSWLVATIWYRSEVRNLGNVPEEGPVLLVGNHSGGNVAPEVITIPLAFSTYFGVERRFYQLAHSLVLASPAGPFLRRWGTMAASHEHARRALESGAAVLVFPGGDWEVHRPSWERHKVDFAGRKGFIKLALSQGVPIVPVVTVGGQETALFLSRGAWLARLTRADRYLRLKVIPISIALPWGLNVGDLLGHIPLPAKITSEVLAPIDLGERFGNEPDLDQVYEHITRVMQETLDSLASERRFPVIG
jgi:1-acyl-sn-glycerol-3-phosphate acyltransferase